MAQENESPIVTSSDGSLAPSRETLGGGAGRLIASAALIGAGALVEPELLGGALLGAGIMYGLPIFGRILRAAATSAVRLSYSAATSVTGVATEARQQVERIVADAQSQQKGP